MEPDKVNSLKLEIWRELMRRQPERLYNQMTTGGSLGAMYQYDPLVAATLAGKVFDTLYPPGVTITTTKPKRRK